MQALIFISILWLILQINYYKQDVIRVTAAAVDITTATKPFSTDYDNYQNLIFSFSAKNEDELRYHIENSLQLKPSKNIIYITEDIILFQNQSINIPNNISLIVCSSNDSSINDDNSINVVNNNNVNKPTRISYLLDIEESNHTTTSTLSYYSISGYCNNNNNNRLFTLSSDSIDLRLERLILSNGGSLVYNKGGHLTLSNILADGKDITSWQMNCSTTMTTSRKDSLVENGNAVVSINGSSLSIINSTFRNFESEMDGGCIYINGNNGKDNNDTSNNSSNGNFILIQNSTFESCNSYQGDGGAISIKNIENTKISIEMSNFLNSNAFNGSGGALSIDGIQITESSFTTDDRMFQSYNTLDDPRNAVVSTNVSPQVIINTKRSAIVSTEETTTTISGIYIPRLIYHDLKRR